LVITTQADIASLAIAAFTLQIALYDFMISFVGKAGQEASALGFGRFLYGL
jgi:hypothetical protein